MQKKPQLKNKNKAIPTHLSAMKKIKLILAFLAVDLIFNWTVCRDEGHHLSFFSHSLGGKNHGHQKKAHFIHHFTPKVIMCLGINVIILARVIADYFL